MKAPWKTMKEWMDDGPSNGTQMIVLLPNGERIIASYHGESQSWVDVYSSTRLLTPVAWTDLAPIPYELIERQRLLIAERQRLDELERSPL